jgi:hypothetical protein
MSNPATFHGGPLDGRQFTTQQVSAIGHLVRSGSHGQTTYALMPNIEEVDRILRGEPASEGNDATPRGSEYVMVRLGPERVEFRHDPQGWAGANQSVEEGKSASGKSWAEVAGSIIAQIRAANVQPGTEVELVYHLNNEHGQPVEPTRVSIVPKVTVDKKLGKAFAVSALQENIIASVSGRVWGFPASPFMLSDGPAFPVVVLDVTVEITPPDEERPLS